MDDEPESIYGAESEEPASSTFTQEGVDDLNEQDPKFSLDDRTPRELEEEKEVHEDLTSPSLLETLADYHSDTPVEAVGLRRDPRRIRPKKLKSPVRGTTPKDLALDERLNTVLQTIDSSLQSSILTGDYSEESQTPYVQKLIQTRMKTVAAIKANTVVIETAEHTPTTGALEHTYPDAPKLKYTFHTDLLTRDEPHLSLTGAAVKEIGLSVKEIRLREVTGSSIANLALDTLQVTGQGVAPETAPDRYLANYPDRKSEGQLKREFKESLTPEQVEGYTSPIQPVIDWDSPRAEIPQFVEDLNPEVSDSFADLYAEGVYGGFTQEPEERDFEQIGTDTEFTPYTRSKAKQDRLDEVRAIRTGTQKVVPEDTSNLTGEELAQRERRIIANTASAATSQAIADAVVDIPKNNDPGGIAISAFILDRIKGHEPGVQANIKMILSTGELFGYEMGLEIDELKSRYGIIAANLAEQIKIEGEVSPTKFSKDRIMATSFFATLEGKIASGPGDRYAGQRLTSAQRSADQEELKEAFSGLDLIADQLIDARTKADNPKYLMIKDQLKGEIIKKWLGEDFAAIHLRDPVTGLPRYQEFGEGKEGYTPPDQSLDLYAQYQGEWDKRPLMASLRLPMPSDFDIMGLATNANVSGTKTGSPMSIAAHERTLPDLSLLGKDGQWPQEVLDSHTMFLNKPGQNLSLAPSLYNQYTQGFADDNKSEVFKLFSAIAKKTSRVLRKHGVDLVGESWGNTSKTPGKRKELHWEELENLRNQGSLLGLSYGTIEQDDLTLSGMSEFNLPRSQIEPEGYVTPEGVIRKNTEEQLARAKELVEFSNRLLDENPASKFGGSDRHGLRTVDSLSETDIFAENVRIGHTEEDAFEAAKNFEILGDPDEEAPIFVDPSTPGLTDQEVYKAITTRAVFEGKIFGQDTDEWLEGRKGKLTGTGASKIKTSKAREKMARRLASQELGLYEPPFISNDYIEQGSKYEPEVRKAFERKYNLQVEDAFFITDTSLSGFGVSPDGYVFDKDGKKLGLVEFKYHQERGAFERGMETYTDQLQFQLMMAKEEVIFFFRMDARTGETKLDIVGTDEHAQEKLRTQGSVMLTRKQELLSDEGIVKELTMESRQSEQIARLQAQLGLQDASAPTVPISDLPLKDYNAMSMEDRARYKTDYLKGVADSKEANIVDVYTTQQDKEARDKEVNVYTSARAEQMSKEEQGYSKNLPKAMQEEMVKRARDISRTEEAKDFALKEAGITVDTRGLGSEEAAEKKMKSIEGDAQAKKAFDERKKDLDLAEQERIEIEKSTESRKKERSAIGDFTRSAMSGARSLKSFSKTVGNAIGVLGSAADEVMNRGMGDIRIARKYAMDDEEGRGIRELFMDRGLTEADAEAAMLQAGNLMDRFDSDPTLYGSMSAQLGIAGVGGTLPGMTDIKEIGLKEFIARMMEGADAQGSKERRAEWLRHTGLDKYSEMEKFSRSEIINAWSSIESKAVIEADKGSKDLYGDSIHKVEKAMALPGGVEVAATAQFANKHPDLAKVAVGVGAVEVASKLFDTSDITDAVSTRLEGIEFQRLQKDPQAFKDKYPERFEYFKGKFGKDSPEIFSGLLSNLKKFSTGPTDTLSAIDTFSENYGGENRYWEHVGREVGSDTKIVGTQLNLKNGLTPQEDIMPSQQIDFAKVMRGEVDIYIHNGTNNEIEAPESISLNPVDQTANSGTSERGAP